MTISMKQKILDSYVWKEGLVIGSLISGKSESVYDTEILPRYVLKNIYLQTAMS